MIGPTGTVRVMVATRPVDVRKGREGPATLVREMMQPAPVRRSDLRLLGKRSDRVKRGVRLFSNLLEDGEFRWPKTEDGARRLRAAQLSAPIEGLEWRRVRAAKETQAPGKRGRFKTQTTYQTPSVQTSVRVTAILSRVAFE